MQKFARQLRNTARPSGAEEPGAEFIGWIERLSRALTLGGIGKREFLEQEHGAAARLVSATSLAAGRGMAVKNATQLLDEFCAAGIPVRGDTSLQAAAVRDRPHTAARRGAPAVSGRAGPWARPATAVAPRKRSHYERSRHHWLQA